MFSKTKPPALSAYIWIIFGACLLALLATGTVGLRALDAHDKATSRMHDRWIASFGLINRVSAGLMDNRNELTLLVQHSLGQAVAARRSRHIRQMRRTIAQVDAEWQAFGNELAASPEIAPSPTTSSSAARPGSNTSRRSSRPPRTSGSPRPWPSKTPTPVRPATRRP
jgi:hypothetical protein